MEKLKEFDSLVIREKKEYTGIPANWKIKPEFCLADGGDEEVFYVVSEKGTPLGLSFLKEAKTYTLYLMDRQGKEILYFEKQFSLFSKKAEVFSADEELLGTIEKSKGANKTAYESHDSAGRLLYQVESPGGAAETFQIARNGMTVGKISRRLGKVMEEGVARQDHFGIIFPMGCDPKEKGVLLGLLFLLDFLY